MKNRGQSSSPPPRPASAPRAGGSAEPEASQPAVPRGPAQLENPSHLAQRCTKPGDFKAGSSRGAGTAPGDPGITQFRNRAGPGEKEPLQKTRPASNREQEKKQNTGVLFLLAGRAPRRLPEDLWHFKVFPFSAALLQD